MQPLWPGDPAAGPAALRPGGSSPPAPAWRRLSPSSRQGRGGDCRI